MVMAGRVIRYAVVTFQVEYQSLYTAFCLKIQVTEITIHLCLTGIINCHLHESLTWTIHERNAAEIAIHLCLTAV